MQTPQKVSPDRGDSLQRQIDELRLALAAIARKTLYSMTVGDANGIHIDIGPNGLPQIDLYPDTSGVHAELKTFPSTDPSGNPTPEILLDVQNASNIQDGGTLRLYSQGAAFGVLEAAGPTSFLYFDNSMRLQFQGDFAQRQSWGGLAGIFFDQFNLGVGSFNFTGSYGSTFATSPFVLICDTVFGGTGGGAQTFAINESSTGYAGTATGPTANHNFRVWAVQAS